MNQPSSSPAAANTTTTTTSWLSQAQQWLSQGNMGSLLGQLPASLKGAGTQISTRYQRLSTTQKVVGGALLAAGAVYLTRRGRNGNGHSHSSTNDEQAATLNELLYFVNDRIEGYKRAVAESQDPQLRGYYQQLVSQSQQFANQLNRYLRQQGGGRQTSTTLKGKLYRGFMEAKAAVTARDEASIIGSNIYGEEWALKAYQDALDDHTLRGAIRQAVERQYQLSQQTYQELKRLDAKQS